jgi:hypothetical protein
MQHLLDVMAPGQTGKSSRVFGEFHVMMARGRVFHLYHPATEASAEGILQRCG